MEEVLSFSRCTEHIQHVLHGESPEVLTYSSLVQTETEHSAIELKGFLSHWALNVKMYKAQNIMTLLAYSKHTHLTGQQLLEAEVCSIFKWSRILCSSIVRDMSGPMMTEIHPGPLLPSSYRSVLVSCLILARLRWVKSPCFSSISSMVCLSSSSTCKSVSCWPECWLREL